MERIEGVRRQDAGEGHVNFYDLHCRSQKLTWRGKWACSRLTKPAEMRVWLTRSLSTIPAKQRSCQSTVIADSQICQPAKTANLRKIASWVVATNQAQNIPEIIPDAESEIGYCDFGRTPEEGKKLRPL